MKFPSNPIKFPWNSHEIPRKSTFISRCGAMAMAISEVVPFEQAVAKIRVAAEAVFIVTIVTIKTEE